MTTTPATLDATAAAFRAALLRRDEAALRRLMAAYQPAYDAIQREVAALTAQIAQARDAGETVRPTWLRQRGRLQALERQITTEWARFADRAERIITQAQRDAVEAAQVEAEALVGAALDEAGVARLGGSVTRLPTEATAALVGVLGDGSPVRELLDTLGEEASALVQAALLRGVSLGRNPRQTARDIRAALGGNLQRALTIARTEQLRAYRTATLERFRENADVLRGWQWRASPSARTCAVCLAMDGREFELDKPFPAHPACRCTVLPLLRGRAAPTRTLGADWFAAQDEATQRAILGPGALKLYQDGKLTLADLVEIKQDPRWGATVRRRALSEIKGERLGRTVANQPSGTGGAGGTGGTGTPGRFATIEEARAWAAQQYPNITWDFEGAHIDAINPTLAQFERLAQEWPDVAKRLEYVGTYLGPNARYAAQDWRDAYAEADGGALGKGRFIGLNPLHYRNPTGFLNSLQESVRVGFHPKGCDTIESVLTHEFGHLVDVWLRTSPNAFRNVVGNDGFGVVRATLHLWTNANRAKKSLSIYATQNIVEAWAEGFTAIYHMPRKNWPVFVQRQAVLLEMLHSRNWSATYQRLRDLSGDALALSEEALMRDRQRVGIK